MSKKRKQLWQKNENFFDEFHEKKIKKIIPNNGFSDLKTKLKFQKKKSTFLDSNSFSSSFSELTKEIEDNRKLRCRSKKNKKNLSNIFSSFNKKKEIDIDDYKIESSDGEVLENEAKKPDIEEVEEGETNEKKGELDETIESSQSSFLDFLITDKGGNSMKNNNDDKNDCGPLTPSKKNIELPETTPTDSAKKKKIKYIKGGFAEKLKTCLDRQRRDKIFRNHKLLYVNKNKNKNIYNKSDNEESMNAYDKNEKYNSKILKCLTKSKLVEKGHLITFECYVLNKELISNDNKLNETIDDKEVQYEVLIQKEQINCPSLLPSSSVFYLNPPWYILKMEKGINVIFASEISLKI